MLRLWCMRLGALAIIGEFSQKDIIIIASKTDNLGSEIPKEF